MPRKPPTEDWRPSPGSAVQRCDCGGWLVDLRPSGGPVLLGPQGVPFGTAEEARDAERRWLSETWGI